ncbi:MAG TPA: hypothetical protein EYN66_05235 [Myxococcales bacterium]|nr:hypothetical protein [Myxococcales bacterium]
MFKSSSIFGTEGSTARLVQLCLGYFSFYVITGLAVKYFLGNAALGLPGMSGLQFLAYSTLGGTSICLFVVLICGWYRYQPQQKVSLLGLQMPSELLYIIPSGICTAVIIPTTTLMYTLPISVMVAMVIMRGSVIVLSRIIDTIQIRQGILTKKVYPEENWGVAFAIGAVAVKVFWVKDGGFDFLNSTAAVVILSSYLTAYAIRIYIMNYFKNTRTQSSTLNNKGFFALEQIQHYASTRCACHHLCTLFVH